MHVARLLLSVSTLAAMAVGGCATRLTTPIPVAAAIAASPQTPTDPRFAAAGSILSGFELADSPSDWQVGDRVLLGIAADNRGVQTVRFLLVELTDRLDASNQIAFTASPKGRPRYRFSSLPAITRLTLFDQSGALLMEADGRFASDLLGCGLWDAVERIADHPELADRDEAMIPIDSPEYRRVMNGWFTLFAFSGSMSKRGMFRDMLTDLIARPSLLQLLFNPSIGLTFADGWPSSAEPWTGPDGSLATPLPTIRTPLLCTIADRPGAAAEVLVTRPVAPLSLCGGVLAVEARNADHADVTMSVHLLAARRGSGGQAWRTGD